LAHKIKEVALKVNQDSDWPRAIWQFISALSHVLQLQISHDRQY
jgi:hypothetical protein